MMSSSDGSDRRDQLRRSLPRPIAFVLGGGGSFGAAQVGMLEALSEYGITPDLVAGTSIGAINGALVAADPTGAAHRLSHLWHSVDNKDVLPGGVIRRILTIVRSKVSIHDAPEIGRLVGDEIGSMAVPDLQLPFIAMAIDADTTQLVTIDRGPVLTAMLASSAIPGVFPPVRWEDRDLYDGGLAANVPVTQALALGARSMVVLDCAFPGQPLKRPGNLIEAALYSMAVGMRHQAERDVPKVATEVPVLYLPGPRPRTISPLDFSAARPLISGAYEVARTFLDRVTIDGPGLYDAQSTIDV